MSREHLAPRDSGVEWLGRVPEHWQIARLKWSIADCINGIWGGEPEGEDDLLCVRVADFDRASSRVSLKRPTYRSVSESERAGRMLNVGDLLLEKSGGGIKQLVGCVVLYDHEVPAVCSNFVGRVVPAENADPAYWTYVHRALYAGRLNYPAIKQTTGIQNLDTNAYFDTPAAFPPLDEQVSIAEYLDHETARIDKLITKQESLIERLDEYRTALVTRTVTKGLPPEAAEAAGLDPEPALKDSGVEWLGEVPEHWKPARVRRIAYLKAGDAIAADNIIEDGPYPVFGGNGIRGFTDRYSHDLTAVLIGRQGALCGNVHIATGRFWASEHAVVAEPLGDVNAYWLVRLLDAMKLNQYSMAAAQPGLAIDRVNDLSVALPPVREQQAIVEYLDSATDRIDALRAKAELSIERLSEYRSALVSAAVTGKIDVRESALAGSGGGV